MLSNLPSSLYHILHKIHSCCLEYYFSHSKMYNEHQILHKITHIYIKMHMQYA